LPPSCLSIYFFAAHGHFLAVSITCSYASLFNQALLIAAFYAPASAAIYADILVRIVFYVPDALLMLLDFMTSLVYPSSSANRSV
jgi:hypothetical protein